MSHKEENAINSVIKENLNKLLGKRPLNTNEINRIKERIRQKLKNPKYSIKKSRLAELFVVFLINLKKIQSQDDFDIFLEKSGFLNKLASQFINQRHYHQSQHKQDGECHCNP